MVVGNEKPVVVSNGLEWGRRWLGACGFKLGVNAARVFSDVATLRPRKDCRAALSALALPAGFNKAIDLERY